jgi:hypothetical protein
MALLFVYIPACFAIAYFLGRKRQIGLNWSLFFCFFLSPIVGFISTMLSPKYYDDPPEPSKTKQVTGWIIAVLFSLPVLGGVAGLASGNASFEIIQGTFMGIGLVGAGIYSAGRGKGKSYHSAAVQKAE